MNDDVEAPDRHEPTELVVAPTRIGGGGRRWRQPGVVAAIVAVAFVGVSIWQPWSGGPGGSSASPRMTVVPDPTSVAAATASPPSVVPGGLSPNPFMPFPSKATLLGAATRQPRWGIRAMVVRDGPPAYTGEPAVVERWVAASEAAVEPTPTSSPPGSPGSSTAPAAALTISGPTDEVAAIGLTTPDDALALDVRIWWLPPGGTPELLAPLGIVGPEAGSWLWLADRRYATTDGMWPAGTYLVEALLGGRIASLVATISASQPAAIPTTRPAFPRHAIGAALAAPHPGFAMVTGGEAVYPTLPTGTVPSDERETWLGDAGGFGGLLHVVSPDVAAIGWIAAPGETVGSVRVEPLSAPISGLTTTVVDIDKVDHPAVMVIPATDLRFPTGAYAVAVDIGGPAGRRTEATVVDILPDGLDPPPRSPLAALGRWRDLIDRPDPAAPQPLVHLAGAAAAGGDCDPATRITASDTLFGIVPPPGVEIGRLRLLPENVTQSADLPIRYAPDAIPGLTVVALPPAGLPVRDYDLFPTLVSAAGETRTALRICVAGG